MLRLLLACVLLAASVRTVVAAPGDIETIAGSPGRGDPLKIQQAPTAMFVRGTKIYTANSGPSILRVIDTATGYEDVIAGVGISGLPVTPSGTLGVYAQLPNDLSGIAVDSAGNIFVADGGSFRIRRVDAVTNIVTEVIGTGTSGSSGDGVPGALAQIGVVGGLAIDGLDRVYIADYSGCLVRRWDPGTGIISTIVGTGVCDFAGDGGMPLAAAIETPRGLAFDSTGRLLIATGNRIRRVAADGSSIETIAGDGGQGSIGDGGSPLSARFDGPSDVLADASGAIYIADAGNESVRKIDSGIITTVAGGGVASPGDGGLATNAALGSALAVAIKPDDGTLLIGQFDGIRRVDGGGILSRYAGTSSISGGDDGPAIDAQIAFTQNIALSSDGSLLLAQESVVRRIAPDGTITTVAGGGNTEPNDAGVPAVGSSIGAAGIAVDPLGGFFIGDYSAKVYRVDEGGTIRRFAGTGDYNGPDFGDGGPALAAQILDPFALATDPAGNLYIADQGSTVRRVDRVTGIITKIAGSYDASGFAGDGGPAVNALINSPRGIAVDSLGNVFLADSGNNRIRKVDTAGTIATVAGTGVNGFNGNDILATTANVGQPMGLAFDLSGNLFVAEADHFMVRRIDPGGTIRAFAGNGTPGYSGDGGPAALAQSFASVGAVAHPSGTVFMVDGNNTRVRRISSITCGDGVLSAGEQCDDGDQVDGNACSNLCRINPVTTSNPSAAPAQQVSTGSDATPATPVQAAVTMPGSTGGAVTITTAAGDGLSGISVLSGLVSISITPIIPPTAADPIVLAFTVDAALVPPGEVVVTKDGDVVAPCATAGTLSPTPSCVSSRTTLPGGDLVVTVLTLSASDWTVGDVCGAAPAGGCKRAPIGKSVLLLKNHATDPTKDQLNWTWSNGDATSISDFGAPLDRTPFTVCIYDDAGLKLQATALPGGNDCGGAKPKACWKQSATGYVYGDKALTPDGLQTLVLKSGATGKAKLVVKGKGTGLQMPALPLKPRLRAQLKVGAGAEARCWEAGFTSVFPSSKPTEQLKAKSD